MSDSKVDSRANQEDYRWLIGPEGGRWLREAKTAQLEHQSLVQMAANLRRELPPERVHLVLEQLELRERARKKYIRAEQMFFTRTGLEQATDEWVAAYKASRFPQGQTAVDFCCGIGGDLGAMAARGPVRGVDKDPVAVLLAEANLRSVGSDERSCN